MSPSCGSLSTEQDLEHFSNPQQRRYLSQLSYLVGRARYRSRSLEDAVDLFRDVDKQTPYFAFAKVMESAAHVRLRQGVPAIHALEQAQAALAGKDDEESVRGRAFAELSMGRVLYSSAIHGSGPADAAVNARALAAAVSHYDRVPMGEYRQDALVETAWAHYMTGDFSRSLGSLTAAKAPAFEPCPDRRPTDWKCCSPTRPAARRRQRSHCRVTHSAEPDRKAISDLLQRMRDDEHPGKLLAWRKRLALAMSHNRSPRCCRAGESALPVPPCHDRA